MNKDAIIEFTNALTSECQGRSHPECPNCGYRMFCYTPPIGWTEELIATVIRCLEQGYKWPPRKDMGDCDH